MSFTTHHSVVPAEKAGKTIKLLKASAKPSSPSKKRRKVELFSTFDEYKQSKQKPQAPPGNSSSQMGNSGNSIAQFLKPPTVNQQAQRDAQMSIDALLRQPGDQQQVAKEEKGKKK